jgi:hypothetical protein
MTVSPDAAPYPADPPAARRAGRELSVELFRPFAGVVVQALVPLRVPPPAVVLAHTVLGLLAVVAVVRGELVLAALLLQAKTVLDNADGRLARATGRVSLVGRYLDTEADFVVNALLFAALGHVVGLPWLALVAFVALTVTLSADFDLSNAYWELHGQAVEDPAPSGSALERMLGAVYERIFGVQDRFLRSFSERRLARIVDGASEDERRHATLAYHDRATITILANLGLSTQLLVLGVCLVVSAPAAYLWLALGCGLLLPLLQARRERRARRSLA